MQVLKALFLGVLLPAVLCAPQPDQRVVSLEDVTGTTARSPIAAAAVAALGATNIGYDQNGYKPAQGGGIVSLEDVTGQVDETVPVFGHPLPNLVPPQQRPQHPGQQQGGVVSLEDVTGQLDQTVPIGHPLPLLPPQPRPPHPLRPGQQGGVVSLEDVTGHVDQTVPVNRPFAQRQPGPLYPAQQGGFDGPVRPHRPGGHPYRGQYEQTSVVCVEQNARPYDASVPFGGYVSRPNTWYDNEVPQHDAVGSPRPPRALSRSRRSPKPIGVVSLENVAGPVAAHYPAYGPPAYVRPNYYNNYYNGGYNGGYYGGYYNRPRPYVYAVPCIGGVPISDEPLGRRPLLPVIDATTATWTAPAPADHARRPGGASERLEEEYYTDYVPREFIR
ncbi:hypothetical protein FOCC_FOCC005153, partial [Frankliniella occidentalis]